MASSADVIDLCTPSPARTLARTAGGGRALDDTNENAPPQHAAAPPSVQAPLPSVQAPPPPSVQALPPSVQAPPPSVQAPLPSVQLPPPTLQVPHIMALGDRCEARYQAQTLGERRTTFYPGHVASVHDDGTYDVQFDDGDFEESVPAVYVRPTQVAAAAASESSLGKRKAQDPVELDDDDDDDCVEVARPADRQLPDVLSTGAPADDEANEDCAFVGRTGDLALSDFPHARENCLTHPFRQGKEAKHCLNCFCLVCDLEASRCTEWHTSHCRATHTDPAWRAARELAKKQREAVARRQREEQQRAATAAARAAAAATASSSGRAMAGHSSAAPAVVASMSVDELLAAVQQVWPVEEREPAGLNPAIRLRPYRASGRLEPHWVARQLGLWPRTVRCDSIPLTARGSRDVALRRAAVAGLHARARALLVPRPGVAWLADRQGAPGAAPERTLWLTTMVRLLSCSRRLPMRRNGYETAARDCV